VPIRLAVTSPFPPSTVVTLAVVSLLVFQVYVLSFAIPIGLNDGTKLVVSEYVRVAVDGASVTVPKIGSSFLHDVSKTPTNKIKDVSFFIIKSLIIYSLFLNRSTKNKPKFILSGISAFKNHLTDFYRANRNSQLFIYGGALLSVAGALMTRETDKVNPIPIIGGICTLIGGAIYLDSFRFLNMNKKKRAKGTRTRSSSNAYDFY